MKEVNSILVLTEEVQRSIEVATSFGLYVPEPITASWIDRESWLKAREYGIGSSEVWALFSEDPNDRLALYLRKIGEVDDSPDDNADMERGRLFEPIAAKKYEELTGRKLLELPLIRHPEIEEILTDVDRLILPETGVGSYLTTSVAAWEAKVPRWHVFSKYKRLGLSDRIIWQTQHHLAATGLPFCGFTAFHADSLSLLEWDIERNAGMVDRILEEVPRFWKDHVEARVPPPVDEAPKATVVVPEIGGEATVRTDPEWLEAAAAYREADPLYKEAETLRKEAIARLRKLTSEKPGDYEGGGVAAKLSLSAGRTSWKDTVDRIADAWPLSSQEFKTLVRNGELRNEDGKTLSDGEVSNLMRVLAFDPYALKVEGKASTRFAPRIMKEPSDG